ncbi:hypothetical protein EDC01DRAFT_47659 [Geopyxis carbonaria]|nr:hypothetical protein EDC01DRAFT_47659 [Geopyxis carbonaria]
MKRFRDISSFPCCPSVPMYRFYGLIVLLFLGSYGAIGSMAFRDIFAQKAYKDSCDGAALMAEIMIVPDFPGFNGHPDAPIYDASSSIRFYKYDKYQYTMDLIRAYNQSLGFDNYGRTRSAANISSEGTLDLALRMAETHTEGDVAGGIEYFNGTKLTEYQQKGKRMHVPGPIGNVHYDLYNSTFDITFANTSAPGFPVNKRSGNFSSSPSGLFMSGLRLEQSDDNLIWRFTDHVCLPPRVRLKQKYHFNDDIYGSIAYDCRYYRMCALKMDDASDREDKKAWWEWVDDIWAVSVGLVAWEFENYSSCCLRNE